MKKICPSLLSADFSDLKNQISELESAGADVLHCDIMDGSFVPNISFGAKIVSDINKITDLPLDVHLMINNPEKYINEFHRAGADYISVHYENNLHLNRIINQIKDLGIKSGVVLNPSTPVFMLEDIIEYADYVLIMSVNPGFGGQKFIPDSLKKIRQLSELIKKNKYNCEIEVDGGVGLNNIKELSDAGADMFVCGNSIFSAKSKSEIIKKMRAILL
ncbi:MAG TPA: ribulose-phosphate 3-epimerase [Ignavibacteria bacterium]|nr:ribulose-phosphate 3-epimerase [Ignavibacteria bacterium]